MLWILLDLLLLLGLVLRLIRAITVEDIGGRLLRWPAERWVERGDLDPLSRAARWKREWWADALSCPFCVGFHLAWLSTLALVLSGGPGEAHLAWRAVAGAAALSYLAGHLAARLDSPGEDDDNDPQQDPQPARHRPEDQEEDQQDQDQPREPRS